MPMSSPVCVCVGILFELLESLQDIYLLLSPTEFESTE